jgi:polysaccharide biosynthesis transport protein
MDHTPAFHPLDYLSVLKRRKWWLIVPSVAGIAVGLALALWLPRTYTASATLGVALPMVSQELVASVPRVTPQERLRSIQQVLFSQPVLERVVREEGLDGQSSMAEATSLLRSRVTPTVPRPDPALPPGSLEQFSIAYSDSTPQAARRIANRLTDAFVAETMRRREVRAEETSAFIAGQLQASRQRLADLEARLTEAKERYMGSLPEQTGANLSILTGLRQQLETTANAIRGEQDRLSVIERQMELMQTGPGEQPGGVPTAASPAAVRVAHLERQLAVARGTYRDAHPEVVRLREELAVARAEAAADAERPEQDRVASLGSDRGYTALAADQQRALLRIRDLERQEAQLRSRIEAYSARVESAPRVEQQMLALQREYDLEREQYNQLAARLRTAEMDETLVRRTGGEQFIVLAAAALPLSPASPNVPRLLLVTVLFGVSVGAGLAFGREYLDRSIHDARGLADLDVPVLGEIPRITPV